MEAATKQQQVATASLNSMKHITAQTLGTK
jgi:hypothetical protein